MVFIAFSLGLWRTPQIVWRLGFFGFLVDSSDRCGVYRVFWASTVDSSDSVVVRVFGFAVDSSDTFSFGVFGAF